MLLFFIWFLVLQVMTLSNGETLVMSGKSLKLVLESGTLEDAAPPTLANCVSVNFSCNLIPVTIVQLLIAYRILSAIKL